MIVVVRPPQSDNLMRIVGSSTIQPIDDVGAEMPALPLPGVRVGGTSAEFGTEGRRAELRRILRPENGRLDGTSQKCVTRLPGRRISWSCIVDRYSIPRQELCTMLSIALASSTTRNACFAWYQMIIRGGYEGVAGYWLQRTSLRAAVELKRHSATSVMRLQIE